jgi:hypothetical protein
VPVTETPDPADSRPPLSQAWWYFIAAAIVVLAPMVGAMVAASSWSDVRQAHVQPIAGPIRPAGKAIAVFSDLDQNRAIVCTGRQGRSAPKPIESAQLELIVEGDGSQWHLVALDASPADGIQVNCAPTDGRADNASYGYALVDGFGAAKIAMVISIGGAVIGVALAVTVAWRRARLFRPPAEA